MRKKKESTLREEQEMAEGKEVITNQVSGNRLQEDQQIATTDDAIDTKTADSGFQKHTIKGKGSELKTEKISDLLTGSSNTSGMGIAASGRNVSGTIGGVLGANNSTPQAQNARNGSRVGKKLDRTATKLNYTPSEQAILSVDESKPLADAAGDDQGYNGSYRNDNARSQKNVGAVPADLLYQRSVDFLAKDKLYFVEGQMNFQNGDDTTAYYPSTTIDPDHQDASGNNLKKPVSYHMGNYLHRYFHFKFDDDGKVSQFYADVENLTADNLNQEDANMCSAHRLIKSNVAELDRMAMDAKAGDEKADIWSCLPRAIDEPTKAAALMSTYEAETGAYVHMAYSKATTNMAFQLNRGPKDGLDEVTPAIEELTGWRTKRTSSTNIGNDFGNVLNRSYIFNRTAYRAGDPSIMIAAYDSDQKYKNKADLLLQPRGFRMHLQTADNNMNPLRVPKEYANVYAATEAFSTIDHEYDPLMPICLTDKSNLILAHNLNETCAFSYDVPNEFDLDITYKANSTAFTPVNTKIISYKWLQAAGYTKVAMAYKKLDVATWGGALSLHYDSANNKYTYGDKSTGTGNEKVKLRILFLTETDKNGDVIIPDGYTTAGTATVSTMTKDLSIDLLSTDDAQVVDYVEVIRTGDYYANHGGKYVYQYDDLRNHYIMHVDHPLVDGIIAYFNNSIGAKFKSLLEQDSYALPLVFSTMYMTTAQLLICAATPWIVRVRENAFKDVIYYEDNIHEYPYSKLASLKEVPFKNYINFEYTDYDSPLVTKIMNPVQAINWTMPEFFWKVDTELYVLPWYFNEVDLKSDGTVDDDAANMSMPSIRSGVRLGLLDNLYGMSEKDIRLSLDRLTKYLLRDNDIDNKYAYKYGRTTDGQIVAGLGSGKVFSLYKILTCPRELGLSMDAPLGLLTIDPADNGFKFDLTVDGTATSYRIYVFTNKANTTEHPTILSASGVNIARGANYVQKWFSIYANNATSNTDLIGLVFGMGDDTHEFSPFAVLGTGASAGLLTTVDSYQRSLNTRLQFLPFVISPFDGNYSSAASHDIYDIAYMFGLCGFRASDYRESVYNREKRVVNEGLLFVSDPWIEDSPIMTGAAKSTGVKLSVGYEIK